MPLRQLHRGSLRRFWTCGARNPWLLALSAGMIVVIWRGILILGPSRGIGVAMVVHFIGLAVAPFLFLRQEGRRIIGLTSGLSVAWAGIAILCGVVAGVVIGVLGMWWYGESDHNWFVTVRDTMLRDARLRALEGPRLFAALAVPAAIFSPIGEELFFRGVFASFVTMAAGRLAAAVWTAAVFGLMHVFHHGVAMGPTGLEIQPVSDHGVGSTHRWLEPFVHVAADAERFDLVCGVLSRGVQCDDGRIYRNRVDVSSVTLVPTAPA